MSDHTPDRATIGLSDGRTLSYLEAGDPAGLPVLFTIGSPSSAVGALAFAPAAERTGVRLICVDKPGYGGSTRDPRRILRQYGADIRDLADALGVDRVALAGQSGGGPHAIAAAHALGERVSALLLIAAYGPVEEEWVSQNTNALISSTNFCARRAPWLLGLPVSLIKFAMGSPERVDKMLERREHKLTPEELEASKAPELSWIKLGVADAFTHGTAGAKDEFHAIGNPWGFRLEDVQAPTEVWHGAEDKSCPIAIGRGLAAHLPNAVLHELPGQGHSFFGPELDEAFASLVARTATSPG